MNGSGQFMTFCVNLAAHDFLCQPGWHSSVCPDSLLSLQAERIENGETWISSSAHFVFRANFLLLLKDTLSRLVLTRAPGSIIISIHVVSCRPDLQGSLCQKTCGSINF